MSLRDRRRNNFKKVAVAGAIAATAGYLAGLLTAPKSGKQTRGDIKHAADKGLDEAEKDLKKLNAELGKVIDEAKVKGEKLNDKAKKELADLQDKAKDTKEKAGEVLGAIRKGDAEDKDLAKAVKDATTALKHLRDYLKK